VYYICSIVNAARFLQVIKLYIHIHTYSHLRTSHSSQLYGLISGELGSYLVIPIFNGFSPSCVKVQ